MSVDAILDRAFVPLREAVEAKRFPGGVLGVVDASGARAVRSIGSAQLVPIQRAMTDDTWFDLASLTKVIFTTPRILALAAGLPAVQPGQLGAEGHLPPMPRSPDTLPRRRPNLHLRHRSQSAACLGAAA